MHRRKLLLILLPALVVLALASAAQIGQVNAAGAPAGDAAPLSALAIREQGQPPVPPPQQTDDGLFTDAPVIPSPRRPLSPAERRVRHVQVRFERLSTPTSPTHQLRLNLFADVTLTAELDRVEGHASGSYSWIGRLAGLAYSQVILTVRDEVLYGSIIYPGGVYEISQAEGKTHAIAEIDQAALRESRVGPKPSMPAPSAPSAPLVDDGSLIDVLVVYTDDSRDAAGGQTQIETLIDSAIAATNNTYTNSGIIQRVRLAATAVVTYNETVSTTIDVGNLRNGNAGLQIARDLRDAYAADLVTMIIEQGGKDCGEAFKVMGTVSNAFAPDAYNVTVRSCAVNNLTFPHELGHLMGARHDWYDDATNNQPYSYNHGYVVTPTLPNPWRTVMAYNDECAAQTPVITCTRIAFWSNPNIVNGGVPTGVPAGTSTTCTANNLNNPECDADNATTLNNTRVTVSNFRPGNLGVVYVNPTCTQVVGVCVEDGSSAFPYDTLTEGAFRAGPNATVWIRPGNYPETLVLVTKTPRGLVLKYPMILRATSGTAIIGQ